MRKKSKTKVLVIVLLFIGVISMITYNPLIDYLSKQAANPEGLIGGIITKIWSGYFNNLNKWSLTLIDIGDYDTILDIGFGGGSNMKNMALENTDCTIYGVDISEESLKTATELNRQQVNDGKVILSLGDAADLPFKDDFFDLLTASQTHIYWEELQKGLSECYRVLVQDGKFLITCEIDKIEYHLSEYRNADDFEALLYMIGFSDVKISNNNNYIAFIATK